MNIQELKKNSINVSDPTVVCCVQYEEFDEDKSSNRLYSVKEEIIDMSRIGRMFNGCYATKDLRICYVVNKEVFVTPYTREAMDIIRKAGLVESSFYVPFSNYDYPKYEEVKWYYLLRLASESYRRDYETDSARWCDEHGIGKLSKKTLKRCFKIPYDGVQVQVKPYPYQSIVYPAINESYFNSSASDRIGHFCANMGNVVFVHYDGHTYVTKGYWILDELRRAGYKESDLDVPFNNGERIIDPYLAAQWERISKK